jgi:sugar lactone lactonase YvrE
MIQRIFVPAIAVLAAACAKPPEPPAPPASQAAAPAVPAGKTITAQRGGFIPEGIEYDQANHRFLTGSLAEGTIFEIRGDGAVVPFVTDPTLVSSVGIEVDEPRDRLLVANSDRAVFQPGATGQAKLNVYSLTTGERLALVDLAAVIGSPSDPPAYFVNDLTVDNDGNVYVTDSRQNVIYKVTPDYQASVLYRFAGPLPGNAQLNGIVYDSDGYLLTVANEHIYKVPVANPAAMSEVSVDEPVPGQDGAVWSPDGPLAVVSNSADAPMVVKLQSADGWATAKRASVARLVGQATTAAAVGGDIYVIHPHFNDAAPPTIEQAVFQ